MTDFHIIDTMLEFQWSRNDVLVIGISFSDLMIKLKHADKSWINILLDNEG